MTKIETLVNLYENPHELGNWLGYDKLTQIHSDWIKYLFDAPGGSTRVLQAHRGSYKTTALVVGIIRDLLFLPNRTHAIIRKSFTDSQKIVSEIQQHFDKDPLRELFSLMKHKDGSRITNPKGDIWKADAMNVSTRTVISKERNIECFGIDTAITGSHHDILHLDDIVTIDDRISKVKREATKQRFYEYINIAMTKKEGMISVAGTPWHKEDAFSIMPDPLKYTIYDINPPILSQDQIDLIKKSIPASLFAANYELKHIANDDAMFANPQYGEWPTEKLLISRICACLDPAYQGSDLTALSMICQTRDGSLYARGWAWRQDVTECYTKIVNILKEYKCGTLYNLETGDKGFSTRDLMKLWPATIGIVEHDNKHITIVSFLKQNFERIKFAVDTETTYMAGIVDYQEGAEPDDAPDSLAKLIKAMNISSANELMNRFGIRV